MVRDDHDERWKDSEGDIMNEKTWVRWLDAYLLEDWQEADEFDPEACILETVGFLTKETEEFVYLTRDLGMDDGNCRGTVAIPKVCILTIKSLEIV